MTKRILLVDDDRAIPRVAEQNSAERSITRSCWAKTARKPSRNTASERIDLVILDLNMPVKNGWATLESLAGEQSAVARRHHYRSFESARPGRKLRVRMR
jgi:DNA-binding response OmpR family regulator